MIAPDDYPAPYNSVELGKRYWRKPYQTISEPRVPAEGKKMRNLTRPLSITLMLLLSGPSFAQWIEYSNVDEGFFVNFPGEPTASEVEWISEYGANIPTNRYGVDGARGNYSMTVVDYRVILRGEEADRINSEAMSINVPRAGRLPGLGLALLFWRLSKAQPPAPDRREKIGVILSLPVSSLDSRFDAGSGRSCRDAIRSSSFLAESSARTVS